MTSLLLLSCKKTKGQKLTNCLLVPIRTYPNINLSKYQEMYNEPSSIDTPGDSLYETIYKGDITDELREL